MPDLFTAYMTRSLTRRRLSGRWSLAAAPSRASTTGEASVSPFSSRCSRGPLPATSCSRCQRATKAPAWVAKGEAPPPFPCGWRATVWHAWDRALRCRRLSHRAPKRPACALPHSPRPRPPPWACRDRLLATGLPTPCRCTCTCGRCMNGRKGKEGKVIGWLGVVAAQWVARGTRTARRGCWRRAGGTSS